MRDLTPFACLTIISILVTISLLAACSPVDNIPPASSETANMQDKVTHERMSQNAMETGHERSWKSNSTSNYGIITPYKLYRSESGSYCRDFTETVSVDRVPHTGNGTACRGDNGVWGVVG